MFYSQALRRFAVLAVSSVLFGATVLVQGQDLPKAPHAEVFPLTPTVGPFTEPAIAVNPGNP